MATTYIINDNRPDGRISYVVAPPGYDWTPTGLKREPLGFRSPGCEHHHDYRRALRFKSHRAAARVANLCPGSVIVPINW